MKPFDWAKESLARLFWAGGFPQRKLRAWRPELGFAMVNYHRVCERGYGGLEFPAYFDLRTEPLVFHQHLRFFDEFFEVTSLDAAMDPRPRKKPPLVITFDDGYRDNLAVAFPMLRSFGFPALIYVATDVLGGHELLWDNLLFFALAEGGAERFARVFGEVFPDAQRLPAQGNGQSNHQIGEMMKAVFEYLTKKSSTHTLRRQKTREIAERLGIQEKQSLVQGVYLTDLDLQALQAGNISIGSHTLSHCLLPYASQSERQAELLESKARLEQVLNQEVRHFCFPSGLHDSSVLQEVQQAGYRTATTVRSGWNKPTDNAFALRRFNVSTQSPFLLALELSGYKEFLKGPFFVQR